MELFSAVPLEDGMKFVARFNIAPTQSVPVIRSEHDGTRSIALLHWGLIPPWADDPAVGNRMINARIETAAEKPAYRHAFAKRRCLIPADGFYEWKHEGKQKQPYYFHPPDDEPFAFAGLWEHWRHGESVIDSCTILTTAADAIVGPIHDRMPFIVDAPAYTRWLDPTTQLNLPDFASMRSARRFKATPVSKQVNNPRNDNPECIAEDATNEFLF